MGKLIEIVDGVRSKNAGPFWLSIDIFCGSTPNYEKVCNGLSTGQIAATLLASPDVIKRFDIPSLNVVKFSLPRPVIQGSIEDRDMHGASWAALIADLEV